MWHPPQKNCPYMHYIILKDSLTQHTLFESITIDGEQISWTHFLNKVFKQRAGKVVVEHLVI